MDTFLADLHQRALVLAEPLHEAFTQAQLDLPTAAYLAHRDYRWLRSHNLRAGARRALEAHASDLDGWLITGNVRRNGPLWLVSKDACLKIRVLREGSDHAVPVAGQNTARRAYYTNVALQPSLFEGDPPARPEDHRLLLLWDERGEADFGLRIIRPIEPGVYRGRVRLDLDLPIPRSRTEFEKLRFEVHDDVDDLGEALLADDEGAQEDEN